MTANPEAPSGEAVHVVSLELKGLVENDAEQNN